MPAAARRCARRARQHRVDDVRREVVVAIGDEDLLPGDAVMPAQPGIVGGDSARRERAEIGPGLRLGQVHRAGPFAGNEPAEIERLLLVGAVGLQQLDRSEGQERAQRKRHACRAPHFEDRGGERQRQALAAVIGGGGKPAPAAFDIAGIGLAKSRRGAHDTVFEDAADTVGRLVQRRQRARREPCRLAEDRFDKVRVRRAVTGQRGQLADPRHLLQHKAHLGDRGGVGHRSLFWADARRWRWRTAETTRLRPRAGGAPEGGLERRWHPCDKIGRSKRRRDG